MLAWLVDWLVSCLVGWLIGWLGDWFVGWLFFCSLSRSLACLLFGLLCFLLLICYAWLTCEGCAVLLLAWLVSWLVACLLAWLTYEARAVDHQKLNQTTPYGVVSLSFWCSTYLPWFGFCLACLICSACYIFLAFFICLACLICLICSICSICLVCLLSFACSLRY